jgi:hypothetical protein
MLSKKPGGETRPPLKKGAQTMTEKECGQAIAKKLREIWEIYQLYYPGGGRLSVIVADDYASVWNAHWDEATERPLDYYEFVEEVVEDATDEDQAVLLL